MSILFEINWDYHTYGWLKSISLGWNSRRFSLIPQGGHDGLSGIGFYWLGFIFDWWFVTRKNVT